MAAKLKRPKSEMCHSQYLLSYNLNAMYLKSATDKSVVPGTPLMRMQNGLQEELYLPESVSEMYWALFLLWELYERLNCDLYSVTEHWKGTSRQ